MYGKDEFQDGKIYRLFTETETDKQSTESEREEHGEMCVFLQSTGATVTCALCSAWDTRTLSSGLDKYITAAHPPCLPPPYLLPVFLEHNTAHQNTAQ